MDITLTTREISKAIAIYMAIQGLDVGDNPCAFFMDKQSGGMNAKFSVEPADYELSISEIKQYIRES